MLAMPAAANPTPHRATRRAALKTGAAALATTTVTGFPTIWAQNIKDVVLRHNGTPVTAIPAIGEQANKDLPFKIQMQASEGNDLLNRMLTAPSAIDCADISITFLRYMVGRDILQAIPVAKVKDWDLTIPVLTKGEYPDGRKASMQGTAPCKVIYANGVDCQSFHEGPSEWLTVLPMITNGDTLGIRPDLTGRPVTSWADLISADFRGRAALQEQPTIGVMDTALALESSGLMKYGDKGNMTKAEIDKTVAIMTDLKKQGHFRSFWSTFDQSVNLMASGEVVIQSMIAPAVAAVRSRGIPCTFQPLKEGYRGWCTAFGVMKHVTGLKLECFYEYLNWYTSGFQGAFIAREGYYAAHPENARKFLTPAEWDYWYGGKPAATEIVNQFGKVMEQPGAVRDGGAFWDRLGHIAAWNAVMDEDRYLTRKWNEFVSA
jgi:putative spermidine/putrescine transport system substrate-binding protein